MRPSHYETVVQAVRSGAGSVAIVADVPPEIARGGGVRVRPCRAGDEPAVLAVLEAAFGGWPTEETGLSAAEFFDYKHHRCPFGPSLKFVAEADGEVVGFTAWMPWPLRAGGDTIPGLRGVDLAVRPDRRGGGIAVDMLRQAVAQLPPEAALTWSNPNQHGRPRSLKSGTTPAGAVRTYARPALGRAREPAPAAAELLGSLREGEVPLLAPGAASGRLETARTLDFLRWRYGTFDHYRAVRADAGLRGHGLAIFRIRPRGRMRVCAVHELLVEGDDVAAARAVLAAVRRSARADVICCAFPSIGFASRCGFAPSRHTAPLAVRRRTRNLPADPTRPSAWNLSLGDLDLL